MSSTTLDRLGKLLAERFGVDREQLTGETTFARLGFDSMDFVTLALALEREFGIELDDDELKPNDTLADSVRLLESRV